jgi:hypothetical protein
MKSFKALLAVGCALSLMSSIALAADQPAVKLTCCQQAAANKKECTHKCCVAAHKDGKSCQKCNPNKEDLKFLKLDKNKAAKAQAQTQPK